MFAHRMAAALHCALHEAALRRDRARALAALRGWAVNEKWCREHCHHCRDRDRRSVAVRSLHEAYRTCSHGVASIYFVPIGVCAHSAVAFERPYKMPSRVVPGLPLSYPPSLFADYS